MCSLLQHRGYDAKRFSAYSIRVTTPTEVVFTVSTYYAHPTYADPDRTLRVLRVRVIGHIRANTVQTQETCDYASWFETFERVWHRTSEAHAALAGVALPSTDTQAAAEAIRALNIPMPKITQRRPGDWYVYLTYEHGTVRCRVRNAGTAAFALWNLRD